MSSVSSETSLMTDINRLRMKRLNFYYSIRPAFVMSRLFGLLPFKINLDSNGNVKSVTANMQIFVVTLVLNLAMAYAIQYSPRTKIGFSNSIMYVQDRLFCNAVFVLFLLSITLDVINRKRLVKIIRGFIAFDKNVRKIGYYFSCNVICFICL